MAITFSRFGSYGRAGNQLFQWACLAALARKKGVDLILHENEIFRYFKHKPKTGEITCELKHKETSYTYDPGQFEALDYSKNIDFLGYFQSEKYFDSKTREEIRWNDGYPEVVRERFKDCFSRPTIAIGIRRTDYVTGPQVYYYLPVSYYLTALEEYFPDWRNYNLVFISDDLSYCKLHFQCLPNAYFPETKDMEQMCLMSLCDHFIIGNSTFHWWAAWLGEKDYSKIVQPNHLFTGQLLEQYGDVNFYSDRWIRHEHEGKRLDLKDVTFTIPVFYDSLDRKINLDICLKLLSEFDTNIIVGEQGTDEFKGYPNYVKFDYEHFHRTKMLNEMARMADAPYIANWDCDVAVPPAQLLETVHRLRQGAEMIYPYEYNFIRLSSKVKDEIRDHWDLGDYAKYNFPNNDSKGKPSFGGAVLWNKQKYFEIGGECEYFISFGPEDVERMERAKKLGVKIDRVPGELYHFPHWCGPDSSVTNPFYKANHAILAKERQMSREELWNWINTWEWHKPYTPDYYDTIVDDAIRSRDEVFRILGLDANSQILDIGCGAGQWGVGLNNYTGVDFNVPREKVMVANYVDFDIRTGVPPVNPADVVLCLEMAEHIEEKYADQLVDTICKLGKKIIFSAAIPFQGGNNHLNEQFQTWWAVKFYKYGFGGKQFEEIQQSENICHWYRQNIVVYSRDYPINEVKDFVLPEYYYEIAKHLSAK
jgi:SAM-dependent methyltransferase